MAIHRKVTPEKGVYEVTSEKKRFKAKPDVCYYINYRADERLIWEKIGWLSEGYSVKLAADIRSERMRSIKFSEEIPRQKKKAPYMNAAWKKYSTWAETNKARGGSEDGYVYRKHIESRFGQYRLNEISSFALEQLKADLTKEGLSPATTKHVLVLIRQIFNKAIIWKDYKGGNPVPAVKMPTIQNQRTRFLSRSEAILLLNELSKVSSRLHDIALLSLGTGMRAGEIFALKAGDIDLINEIITVRDPKNKTMRHVYMNVTIKEMLVERMPAEREAFIFPDAAGNQGKTVSKTFRKTVDQLEFNKGVKDPREKVVFHTLRHSFASWLALNNETLQTIGDLLGHKDLIMTRRYSHLSPDHKRRATVSIELDATEQTAEVTSINGK